MPYVTPAQLAQPPFHPSFYKDAHILQPEFLFLQTFKISTSKPSLDTALECMALNVTAHGDVIPSVGNHC